ncbi:NUDIX domain-containing protein [Ancylobacter vacuolatus]|uniref:GDP-mannose pyrophosphatase n=1 Tax=Ancylobacter vacuolatus TaxID=223389 RepID=A0ABU0DMQ3_9HYPH|nr:NUDIX domain-containing protein [Ancylobacter vacuolatus]MDQ0349692.1 ADP-ribose pyrophosphatase [Ancylobacter vacuolatus]
MSGRAKAGELADRSIELDLTGPEEVGAGFRPYHRFIATFEGADGAPLRQRRDILRVGSVVGVLAYDPAAACFVLIRQFRLGAQLATGEGELVEIAAGIIDPGEEAEAAARRECVEEIGVAPRALLLIARFLPSPGVSDEHATVYLGLVDSTDVPDVAGEPGETELTRPFLVPVDEALASLAAPFPAPIANGFVLIALQWFALNRERVAAFVAASR